MVSAFLMGAVLIAAEPSRPVGAPDPRDRVAYEEARARLGPDSEGQVRLALWCEAHGLTSERLEQLAHAILRDPANARARSLLGMLSYAGSWARPEDVATRVQADESLQKTLAEYNARREQTAETADAHWLLGVWRDEHGLKPEALAHYTVVTRLDPDRADAWHRLGCRKVGNRWLSDAQAAAEVAERDAQRRADLVWAARLKGWWRDWLASGEDHARFENEVDAQVDARAVPSIRKLFDKGSKEQQLFAVRLYDRIDSRDATTDLVRLATADRSQQVRTAALEALSGRDPQEVIRPLISVMRDKIQTQVSSAPGGGTQLRAEDEQTVLNKLYVNRRGWRGPLAPAGRSAQTQLRVDLARIENRNERRAETTDSARSILKELTGKDFGSDPSVWRHWLEAEQGTAYQRPYLTPTPKRQIKRTYVGFHGACFALGTPVQTLQGPRPIETLRVGDQVLRADPATGALSYQPVVVVYHNPPNPALTLRFEDQPIVSTPIHRFWRAGKGWVLARDLEPGDTLRVVEGTVRVSSVEANEVQPVFNLEVAASHTYFVGSQGALVHDNSEVRPVAEPFDATGTIAAVSQSSK